GARTEGSRRRGHEGPLVAEPDHRDHEGDDRMGARTDAARAAAVASRGELAEEVARLEAAGREAVDIPAKIRRAPARTAGLAAGEAFVVAGGPKRLLRAGPRALRGPDADLAKSIRPTGIGRPASELPPWLPPGRPHRSRRGDRPPG